MRLQDRQIRDPEIIQEIIQRSMVCRLGLVDGDQPYVVPLCFGYKENTLYFHCAAEGYKLDLLKKNTKVCVEFDIDQQLISGEKACQWSMNYRSVIGFGKAFIVAERDAKRAALDVIMDHYAHGPYEYIPSSLDKVCIVQVEIETMTCKVRQEL
jgi:nitroimidazol reductase NimA-like FMN-containing flavoprotein (pyridoxamine 5'-phosphate oxidase superfamily)